MPDATMLDLAQEHLGWPGPKDIFGPSGSGPKVLAEAADRKIGSQIRRLSGGKDVRVGILAANPSGDATEAAVALLCQFDRPAPQDILLQAQRLAWNFSWSRHLVIVEPDLIRSFTCCKPPGEKDMSGYMVTPPIERKQLSLSDQAASALHWVNLVSGQYIRDNSGRFSRDGTLSEMLLANLSCARRLLLDQGPDLGEDVCHDLLARVIFIQFLIDRKDSGGNATLDRSRLEKICGRGTLGESLRDKASAYELFRYMNQKFNGDLFAGSPDDRPGESAEALREESSRVNEKHLGLLADLVEGKLRMDDGQLCLWRQYSFDVVPLAFVSSVYEEFVTKRQRREKGAHYTRPHLVDFILDGVLPWNGETWNLRILDPACGSGIFLVKAFQRLVHRWKTAHTGQSLDPGELTKLLEENFFGVDSNPHAVRVASFSLYLAMCDEIDPMRLWEQVRFPALRGKRIVCSDFFDEGLAGFRTREDARSYDMVIGNPPWGKSSLSASEAAKRWAAQEKWPAPNKDVGPLFLAKAAFLLKQDGIASLMQPAQNVLTNLKSKELRKKLFTAFKVEEVVNLSALRKWLFPKSKSPACIINFRPIPPDGQPLAYLCPKPSLDYENENEDVIVVTHYDVNYVFPHEAANEPRVWSVLMWGGRRDLNLIRNLGEKPTLRKLKGAGVVKTRGPIIRGKGKKKVQHELLNRRILGRGAKVGQYFPYLRASVLPVNTDAEIHWKDSTALGGFQIPQLLINQSWEAKGQRFRAYLVEPDDTGQGVVFTSNFVTAHTQKDRLAELEAACVTYNSIFAVYYLFLVNGQFSGYRPKVQEEDLLSVPLPQSREGILKDLNYLIDVDERVREAFDFREVEWALIEDMARYTIPSFHNRESYRWQRTKRSEKSASELHLYCDYFRRVLKAGFGEDKELSFTVFEEDQGAKPLPVRLVAVHFDSPLGDTLRHEPLDNKALLDRLNTLYQTLISPQTPNQKGPTYRRIIRVYDTAVLQGRDVPTVYLIKPDDVRLWTRSTALRDADEVSADIISWHGQYSGSVVEEGETA